MRSIRKVVGAMSCACLLCLGLSDTAVLAADDNMQLGPAGERIGGQAGHKAEKEKLQGVGGKPSSGRVGGQAGEKQSKEKLKGVIADDADHRMGGQAGHKGAEDLLERPAKK
ncbi:MAG: hypothetical protein HP497_05620 [Nitrospira sp.]|nr:hypothetical protein [Nitrospira sp.]